MKTSGSPCPQDQLSIICFKRCPFLRTYLSEIIRTAWSTGSVPNEWKRACTILIHKKENANDPANFRPITLQSVPLKVFTSCLRNAIFNFLSANNYIEHEIQKGFTPGLSGTFEHTAEMADIINKARTKQRSLVITLLNLKNAFGEVHHHWLPPHSRSYQITGEKSVHWLQNLHSYKCISYQLNDRSSGLFPGKGKNLHNSLEITGSSFSFSNIAVSPGRKQIYIYTT